MVKVRGGGAGHGFKSDGFRIVFVPFGAHGVMWGGGHVCRCMSPCLYIHSMLPSVQFCIAVFTCLHTIRNMCAHVLDFWVAQASKG